MTIPVLISGVLFASILAYFGLRLRYGKAYHLIAGYNRASESERENYQIEALSHHLGNGLMTIAVLLISATAGALMNSLVWCLGSMGLLVFVALIIVIGGRKFLPDAAQPGEHRLLRFLLPDKAFRAVRDGTKEWLSECSCGHLVDYWEAGGVRYNAVGNPRELRCCEACGKLAWQKVRRKTAAEKNSMP